MLIGQPLYFMAIALFTRHDLITKFNIDRKKLMTFVNRIQKGYRDNSYHNARHAADVLQSLNFFITKGGLSRVRHFTMCWYSYNLVSYRN